MWRYLTACILVVIFSGRASASVPEAAAGYIPHDPIYIQAEPYLPYTSTAKNPSYVWTSSLWDEQIAFFGFAPYRTRGSVRYHDTVRSGLPQVSGSSVDKAWTIEKGDPGTLIAIIDTGFAFEPPQSDTMLEYAQDRDVADRLFLNKHELEGTPPDIDPLTGLPLWDLYGAVDPVTGQEGPDGRFSAADYRDWWADGRIADYNDNGYLDPQDIIHAGFTNTAGKQHLFADGIDNDGNGFVDDICGWDFFEDDNDPYDVSSYATAEHHARGQLALAAGQQDNGFSGSGVCPECSMLPLKNWDSFAVDTMYYGTAVLYATRMGASVIEGAIGGMNNSGICQQAFKQAYAAGIPIFIVSSDLNTANHNYPTYLNEPIYCTGMVPDTYPLPLPPTTYFRNSNLAQFGAKNQISFEVMSGSESTAMSSGAGGLILSHARRMGLILHPDQVKQLLCMTAEDVLPANLGSIGTPDPAQVGWDQHFGYGRVDLHKALLWLENGMIPPVARITAPAWSTYLDPRQDTLALYGEVRPSGTSGVTWTVEAGYGIEPTQFTTIAQGTGTGAEMLLADVNLDKIEAVFPSSVKPTDDDLSTFAHTPDPRHSWEANIQPNRHLFTIRLRVTDNQTGVMGEDRRTFFLHADKTLHTGWPQYIGVGGEGAVRFADLDGDNLKEVIVPTSDGRILVYTHNGKLKHTFYAEPFDLITRHNLGGADLRPGFFSLAVGDIDADGIQEIVGAAGNWLYCFKATGAPQAGFPVPYATHFFADAAIKDAQSTRSLSHANHIEPGGMGSPVLFDLNADGRKEIMFAAGDQRVYAWDAQGVPLKGWPVYARRYATGGGIIHPPCMADINGDGTPEVVVTTNEAVSMAQSGNLTLSALAHQTLAAGIPAEIFPFVLSLLTTFVGQDGLVYALRAEGTGIDSTDNGRVIDTDAFMDNWPVHIKALLPGILPQLGPSTKPCAFDYNQDGKDEIVAGVTSAKACIIDGKGHILMNLDQGPMGAQALGIRDRSLAINAFDSMALGDITGDGVPEIVCGGMTLMGALNLVIAGQNFPFNHIIEAWDITTGSFLEAYPRAIDDWVGWQEPALADVSGDGIPDVLVGSGLYLLHAFGADATEQAGFPKLNAGWVVTTPAVDDIDNDGRNELGVVTREGWIFIWDTAGKASTVPGWPTTGHDNHNTSNLGSDATPPASVTDLTRTAGVLTFTCPGDDGFAGRAALLKIYGSTRPIDVTSIRDATLIKQTNAAAGGSAMSVAIPDAYPYYAVIAVDEAGNASQLPLEVGSVVPEETDAGASGSDDHDGGLCFITTARR